MLLKFTILLAKFAQNSNKFKLFVKKFAKLLRFCFKIAKSIDLYELPVGQGGFRPPPLIITRRSTLEAFPGRLVFSSARKIFAGSFWKNLVWKDRNRRKFWSYIGKKINFPLIFYQTSQVS